MSGLPNSVGKIHCPPLVQSDSQTLTLNPSDQIWVLFFLQFPPLHNITLPFSLSLQPLLIRTVECCFLINLPCFCLLLFDPLIAKITDQKHKNTSHLQKSVNPFFSCHFVFQCNHPSKQLVLHVDPISLSLLSLIFNIFSYFMCKINKHSFFLYKNAPYRVLLYHDSIGNYVRIYRFYSDCVS